MKHSIYLFTLFSLLVISCSSNQKENAPELSSLDDELTEEEMRDEAMMDEEMMDEDTVYTMSSAPENDSIERTGIYQIQEHDTLMWISYKIYGDYTKWRNILVANPEINENKLAIGTDIFYIEPDETFIWERDGTPYRIERGDTLIKISKKLYNTSKNWKQLLANNSDMIKDPNMIYANFILFYSKESTSPEISKAQY